MNDQTSGDGTPGSGGSQQVDQPGLTGAQRRVGWAYAGLQGIKGLPEACWAPLIPAVASRLHLTPTELGNYLLGLSIGLGLGVWVAPHVMAWLGSRTTLRIGFIGCLGLFPFAPIAPDPIVLGAILGFVGAGFSWVDYVWWIYARAYQIEIKASRHTMQLLQIPYAPGALAGIGCAALGLHQHWPGFWVLAAVCWTGLAATLVMTSPLEPGLDPRKGGEEATATAQTKRRRNTLALFLILLLAASVMYLPLGVTNGWSALYLEKLGAKGALITYGLVGFYAAQTVGSVIAYFFSDQLKGTAIVLTGTLLAVAGGLLIAFHLDLWTVVGGFVLVALGLSPAGPYVQTHGTPLTQQGNHQLRSAALTFASYVGGVVGQPAISRLTALSGSLAIAMLLIPGSAGVVAIAVILGGSSQSMTGPRLSVHHE